MVYPKEVNKALSEAIATIKHAKQLTEYMTPTLQVDCYALIEQAEHELYVARQLVSKGGKMKEWKEAV